LLAVEVVATKELLAMGLTLPLVLKEWVKGVALEKHEAHQVVAMRLN